MSKKITILLLAAVFVMASCSDVKRKPGTVYMPDMAYSRAYESYANYSNLADKKINYTGRTVAGTIARDEDLPFHIPMDVAGDTTNYTASKAVKNPITTMTAVETKEAERLYLINCGICHGANLNGNGPLYNDGKGPYPSRPATLVGDPRYEAMPDGQMFYSLAYGKNYMGSYASQLSRKQRWMVIKYIKDKQQEGKAAATDTTAKK
ncbi:MAG: c-type cytochrome [Bacteroidota bacterium]|jgi:cytochrome c553